MGGWLRDAMRRAARVRARALRIASSRTGRSFLLWSAAPVRWTCLSVVDFLVEDACALCRRPNGTAAKRAPATGGPADRLAAPVSVSRLFGIVTALNHPVCADCAGNFVVARTAGRLGRYAGDGVIETTAGETFGAAPHGPPGAERPRAEVTNEWIPVVSPFMTTESALKIIHLFKFDRYQALALPVADTMAWAFRESGICVGDRAILVPAPMDARSESERRFNHAAELARHVAGELGLRVADRALIKARRTRTQSKTAREDRAANVRDAFRSPVGLPELADADVWLVDDLVTTGATAAACGAALLRGGARSVAVLCFARAL